MNVIDHNNEILSEEWMTNCYTADGEGGCGGGFTPIHAWLAPQGAVYETEDPWTTSEGAAPNGNTGACGGPYTFHETVDANILITGASETTEAPDSNMKKALYYYGPIFSYVYANSTAFSDYTGGVFTETGNVATDHCIMLVGYVDSANVAGGGYWILRNSWNTSWGINGYMYISYGSDYVGQGAAYVVYKGGIPYSVPPVAAFSVSSTSSCTGTIQFTDASTNVPTSWSWDFGDGGTSSVKNPTHTYTTNGTYTVSLKATNSYGNNTVTQTNYITINLPPSPTVTGGTTTVGGSVNLSASGSGTLNWYDAATGGTLVNAGPSYSISSLNATDTFYVENDVAAAIQSVGMASSALSTNTGGYYTSSSRQGLTFDALAPFTIDSVTVYEQTSGSRTIWLENSAGTEIDSLVKTVSAGKQTIALNFLVPAGTGYTLGASSKCGFWREKSGASYPYTISNLISITGSTSTNTGYYIYFYNWKVQGASCTSARTPVTATVLTGINELTETDFNVFPNPNSGRFEIRLNNQYFQNATVSMMNIIGEVLVEKKINSKELVQFDASSFPSGVYYIKLQAENGTYIKKVCLK
jgi:PKD repeat protein